MQQGKFKEGVKGLLRWFLSVLTPFIIGSVFGCFAVIVVLEYLNIIHWVKYVPQWAIAITACYGLLTWRKKLSYERKMGIVDSFLDAVHEFILKIGSEIQILQILEISIEQYEETFRTDQHRQKKFVCGLEEFIETHGKHYCTQLTDGLSNLPITHISTLGTKIRTLNMKDSISAAACYRHLLWVYDTIQKTATKLGNTSLYWKNPEVEKVMRELCDLNIDQLKKSLDKAEYLMLKFAERNYK